MHLFLSIAVPPGNLSSLNWQSLDKVSPVDCVPLSVILHKAHVRHINFFILDVEVLCASSYLLCNAFLDTSSD